MFKDQLKKIISRTNLTQQEMSDMMMEIFSGDIGDAQIGAMMGAQIPFPGGISGTSSVMPGSYGSNR